MSWSTNGPAGSRRWPRFEIADGGPVARRCDVVASTSGDAVAVHFGSAGPWESIDTPETN